MGRTANIIKILEELSKSDILTKAMLSEKIGITPRMVQYYVRELIEIGIPISSDSGRNVGGYKLDRKGFIKFFHLD
ncbi:winged helix-turn-helix transcriptional regulator [Bacillus sp. 1P06AnD]|uniref:winged helix-turn-helix transcriptional regulator n=1 Tax=Bacillus sp. 1P06AnD TaxID=3132208 RepID=UPI00399EFCC0